MYKGRVLGRMKEMSPVSSKEEEKVEGEEEDIVTDTQTTSTNM